MGEEVEGVGVAWDDMEGRRGMDAREVSLGLVLVNNGCGVVDVGVPGAEEADMAVDVGVGV